MTFDLNKKSQVTSHWSWPGLRIKRSEVTSLRSNVLYFQRSKVSQFIWVHKVKGQKSKVMGMGPMYVQHSRFWGKNQNKLTFDFEEMEDDLNFF